MGTDWMNDGITSRPDSRNSQRATVKSCGAGVPPAVFLPLGGALTIRSRRLPHWEVREAVYFVTFRLADSLPKNALQKIVSRRNDISATASQMTRKLTASERRKLGQLHARRLERTLDEGAGGCFLHNSA